MPEIPASEYDGPREVFAFFGLAYYQAAVLEHGVLNLAVAMVGKSTPGITLADLDKFYDSFEHHTFGRVINAAKSKVDSKLQSMWRGESASEGGFQESKHDHDLTVV